MPFQKNGIVNQTVLVMNPDYGSRLAAAKNCDARSCRYRSGEQKAIFSVPELRITEIEQRLEQNRRNQQLIPTRWQNGIAILA